ncbi:MAG: carbohydrate ABC transporter permease, partial [Rhodospirillaceae bacterium]|nr:carbohydrate ABC transporter permease [Rhodospirillaceae bacterium]
MRPRRLGQALASAVSLALALLMFFPVLWTALTGFKSESDALAIPPLLWFVPSLDKYLHAFAQGDYLTFFTNTIVVVGVSIAVALAFALPAAYKLAFFPGRRA